MSRKQEAMHYRLTVSIHPMPHDDRVLQSLRERLEQIPGVHSVSIHPQTEMAYVVCDNTNVTADMLFAAIDQARLKTDDQARAKTDQRKS
jgi:cation transport ATPase